MLAPTHDPGGKVKIAIPDGMSGTAEFYGDREQYRLWLQRCWIKLNEPRRTIMFVGMNPSTASYEVNDPTVLREVNFSKAWGFNEYLKTNVMDYRATYPKDLLADGVIPRSDHNIPTILRLAEHADKIVCAWGVVTKKLAHYADETRDRLLVAGHRKKMFCLGRTLMGHPRHPLYLKADTKLEPYP